MKRALTAFFAIAATVAEASSALASFKSDAAALVHEISQGVYLVMETRDREHILPVLSVVEVGRKDSGDEADWANITRCNPHGFVVDGNVCLQYFMSGKKVPLKSPHMANGAILPDLMTADGKHLSATEASSLSRRLPGGDLVEVVDLESEVGGRMHSPWETEPIYPHLYLQDLVRGTCRCIMGLRRISPDGKVMWSYSYFWHPGGLAEASGKVESDPILEPVIALNAVAMPGRSDVVLVTSTAELSGMTAKGDVVRWPTLVVSVDLATCRPTSELTGFQPVSFEHLVEFTINQISDRFKRGLIKKEDSEIIGGRRDIYLPEFADEFDDYVLKTYPRLRDPWRP